MGWTQEKLLSTFAEMQEKSAKDEGFRASLKSDPNGAIAKLSGMAVPAGFKLKIIDEDPAYSATFVMPPLTAGEVSVDALDAVAGGAAGDLAEEECIPIPRR